MARRFEAKELVFWAVPVAIALVAAVFAWRAYRQEAWAPLRDDAEPRLSEPCAMGQWRCRSRRLETTTGEHGDGGPLSCQWKESVPCARVCTTELASLAGVELKLAKEQLCDPPKQPLALLATTESFLDAPIADAGVCEGDGYIPTEEGFLQCITRAGGDRVAPGVVIARSRCVAGAIATLERRPQLIKREEAAALWCKRDPIADVEPEADAGVDAFSDAMTDVDAGEAG